MSERNPERGCSSRWRMAVFVGMRVIISLLRVINDAACCTVSSWELLHLHAEHQCNVPPWQSNMCFPQIALLPLILIIRPEFQIRANTSSIFHKEATSYTWFKIRWDMTSILTIKEPYQSIFYLSAVTISRDLPYLLQMLLLKCDQVYSSVDLSLHLLPIHRHSCWNRVKKHYRTNESC